MDIDTPEEPHMVDCRTAVATSATNLLAVLPDNRIHMEGLED